MKIGVLYGDMCGTFLISYGAKYWDCPFGEAQHSYHEKLLRGFNVAVSCWKLSVFQEGRGFNAFCRVMRLPPSVEKDA